MKRLALLRHLAVTAAGLLVAPDALELIVEPRRRYWPGWSPMIQRHEWWVDPTLDSYELANGSFVTPFRTLREALDRCAPGDCVQLLPGKHELAILREGEELHDLTFVGHGTPASVWIRPLEAWGCIR